MDEATVRDQKPGGKPEGVRERKRRETADRIASEAARLVTEHGLSRTTVEEIAAAAQISRATFFRYYDTKERAVATGLARVWLQVIVDALDRQPARLGALDAVRRAFRQLAAEFDGRQTFILDQAKLSRSDASLGAWTLQLYVEIEEAIAESVARRVDDLTDHDLRPRLVGAATMAVLRLTLDDWVDGGGAGNLPAMIATGLQTVSIDGA